MTDPWRKPVDVREFRTGTIRRYTCWEITCPDGEVNNFFPAYPMDEQWYHDVARAHGYRDTLQYAWEHDLTHMWLSERLGWERSEAVWEGAVMPGKQMEGKTAYEEHMVNSLQRYVNMQVLDDEYGQLEEAFGDEIGNVREELLAVYNRDAS